MELFPVSPPQSLMTFLKSLLIAVAAAVCLRATPSNGVTGGATGSLLPPGIPLPNAEGYSDGFYYRTSSNSVDKVNFTNGQAGEFSFVWGSKNYFTEVGKGWGIGSKNR